MMKHGKATLATLIKQIVVSSTYASTLFVATGLPQTALAVSCNDLVPGTSIRYADALVHFVYDGSKTFAIAKSAATGSLDLPDAFFAFSSGIDRAYQYNGTDTSSLKLLVNGGKYGAARPVSIESKAKQDFITKEFLQFLGPADSAKSTYIDAWKEYGASELFTDMAGGALSYTNWPVGGVPKTSLISSPQAVTMGSDGVWKNGENAQRISQIVEFGGKLDCALDLTSISSDSFPPPQDPPETPGANGELMCAKDLNQDGDIAVEEAASCIHTEQGALCPIESVNCVRPEGAPNCAPGTLFDNVSNKCVQITSPTCQSGTYDSITGQCSTLEFPFPCLRTEGAWCVLADINRHDICGYMGTSTTNCWNTDGGLECAEERILCQNVSIKPYAPNYISWTSTSKREVIDINIPKFTGKWSLYWAAVDDAAVSLYKESTLLYTINSGNGASNTHNETNDDETLTGQVTGDNIDGNPKLIIKIEGTNTYSNPTCLPNLEFDPTLKKCAVSPSCADGSTYDDVTKKCIGPYDCPLGPDLACMESDGTYQCSPNSCFEQATPPGGEEEAILDESMLQDDARNSDGSCSGQIMIFTGKPSRCRPPGLKVGYVNDCCESDQMLSEDVGNTAQTAVSAIKTMYEIGQVAYYSYMVSTGAYTATTVGGVTTVATTAGTTVASLSGAVGSGVAAGAAAGTAGATTASVMTASMQAYAAALLNPATIAVAVAVMVAMKVVMGSGCDQTDIQTGGQVESKQCHYVGSYCEKKWPLVGCVQKAKGYCCFNSMMGRIIHEQGRPQLTTFAPDGAWGSPQSPNCRGFVPGEFETLDFAKIDMSEYFGELQKDMALKIQNAQNKIDTTIQQRTQQIRNPQ